MTPASDEVKSPPLSCGAESKLRCQSICLFTPHLTGGGDQMRITGFMHRVDCIVCGTRIERMARWVWDCDWAALGVGRRSCDRWRRLCLFIHLFLFPPTPRPEDKKKPSICDDCSLQVRVPTYKHCVC